MPNKLKWLFIVMCLAGFSLALLMTGCVTESAKVTEYNDAGKIVKVTETSQSDAVKKIMDEMEKKNVVIWKQGWYFALRATTNSSDNGAPVVELSGGKVNTGHLSIKDGTVDIPSIIRSIQQPVTVSANGGGIEIKETDTSPIESDGAASKNTGGS